MSIKKQALVLLSVTLLLATPAFAASGTPDFVIDNIYNQWSSDMVHVVPVGPHTMVNPQNCSASGQYGLDSQTPGHKERVSFVLAALLNNRVVAFVIEGCTSDQRCHLRLETEPLLRFGWVAGC